jgi:hypothetical protein
MLPKPLSAIVILCEKILNEDNIVSAIRIIDTFFIPPPRDGGPPENAVLMHMLAVCKFSPDDDSTHLITLRLRRPDGTENDIDFGKPFEASLADLKPRIPGVPPAINLMAPVGVKATHMGLHRVILFVDGEEVAAALFTLLPAPEQATA